MGLACAWECDPSPQKSQSRTFFGEADSSRRFVLRVGKTNDRCFQGEPKNVEKSPLDQAAETILDWLNTEAEYPKRPWFDVGPFKGFQMFFVPWMLENDDEFLGYSGQIVVEPKWFEGHK